MVECVNKNIWYNTKNRRKNRRFFKIILFFTIFIGIFLYYRFIVTEMIFRVCEDGLYSICTECVNDAVLLSLKEDAKYSDLITVEKNSDGDIELISADSYKINIINRETAVLTQKNIETKIKDGISIPFMAFSGISILSGYGSEVNFKSLSISSVVCDFKGEFKSTGINQTLHSLYVDVICKININMPFDKKVTVCNTKILIGEAVLVGKVPEVYFNGKIFS